MIDNTMCAAYLVCSAAASKKSGKKKGGKKGKAAAAAAPAPTAADRAATEAGITAVLDVDHTLVMSAHRVCYIACGLTHRLLCGDDTAASSKLGAIPLGPAGVMGLGRGGVLGGGLGPLAGAGAGVSAAAGMRPLLSGDQPVSMEQLFGGVAAAKPADVNKPKPQ